MSAVDLRGRAIFVADAHRDNGRRFIVSADELERVTRESGKREDFNNAQSNKN